MSGYVPGRRCDVCGGESPRVPTCGECEIAQRYEARIEALQALCREAADALRAIDSALECECVCDCASDEQEHEPECQRCAACTVDDALPARLRARLRAAGGGT